MPIRCFHICIPNGSRTYKPKETISVSTNGIKLDHNNEQYALEKSVIVRKVLQHLLGV